ncbi:flagellar hook-associated protein 2 [Bacillus thermotolerans]|uniref:Flagellar hook-associated protein 2 n=1 Tax=Bacillus thermotolerans TaxID=1221996 RepID=A0A0F5I801_BACTR|nr:flagellar hook-associated protein 2 [Bacillus thermotolerans]KKB38731.1 Flagellar hook-associated protein FliD [Bacillus thermotolerans]KKB41312.1 Flagellar hook-associated protein FliD [Bacillus thermotolerans]KKB44023.1 Flagellar hook-associated protein FliD [Bacillus thermotolerans]
MRIGGLASGMDIDQMVKDLMTAERMPVNKLEQKKQFLEWQRDDYRDMNKTLFEFDNMIFDGVMKQANYIQKKISVSDDSVVSVRNLSSTGDFTGTIQVKQLASSATMASSAGVGTNVDPKKTIKELFSLTGEQTMKVSAIEKDGTLGEPKEITFNADEETLDGLIVKINNQTGVSMFFDNASGKASVMAKNSGDVAGGAEIVLDGAFFTKLNLSADNTEAGAYNTAGQNAKAVLNGLEIERASNTFSINGVEYTLKKADPNTSVNISASADTDKVFETIKGFVDKYNEVIEKINGELNEKRYRDYQPLTKEEREALSEKEIELWEEKARSGTLRGDSLLSSGLNQMRSVLYETVTTAAGNTHLTDFGISTSSNYLDRGKLVIDEKKLKEAIAENPTALYELFTADGETEAEQGIARRLRETISDTRSAVEKRAGKASSVNNTFTLGRTLENIEDQIDRFQEKLITIEDRYWRQFTAMEKAVQRSNEQMAMLMNQFQ